MPVDENNIWWEEDAELNGVKASVEVKSVTVATGVQWREVKYYLWTHAKNVDASRPQKFIVCWHGLARNAHDFDILAQYLVKTIPNARVVSVDTAGRGMSEKLVNGAGYNLQTYAIDFMAIYNAEGAPAEVEWVGISMGGLLAMVLCAASIKCPIKKAVLVDVGPFVSASAVARIGTYVGKDPHFDSLSHAVSYFKDIYGKMGSDISDAQWQWMARFLTKTNADGKLVLHYDPAISHAFSAQEPKDIDLWALWDLIQTPIMVYHGLESDLLTREIVQQMNSRGPKLYKTVEFPNVGHTPHLYNLKNCQPIIDWFSAQ